MAWVQVSIAGLHFSCYVLLLLCMAYKGLCLLLIGKLSVQAMNCLPQYLLPNSVEVRDKTLSFIAFCLTIENIHISGNVYLLKKKDNLSCCLALDKRPANCWVRFLNESIEKVGVEVALNPLTSFFCWGDSPSLYWCPLSPKPKADWKREQIGMCYFYTLLVHSWLQT